MTAVAADVVCLAPLRVEAMAVTSGMRSHGAGRTARVVRTGAGGSRSARAAQAAAVAPGAGDAPGAAGAPEGLGGVATLATVVAPATGLAPATVVTGVAGGLVPGLTAGQLVVADRLTGPDGSPVAVDGEVAASLADALRAAGLPVRLGPVATSGTLVRGAAARSALAAATGAIAVDLESSVLAAGAGPGPFAVVRAIADRPGAELVSPATVFGGIAALRSLRRAAPVVALWAGTLRSRPRSTTPGHP